MNHQPPNTTMPGSFDNLLPDDEQLVAYLDGELDQTSVLDVEGRLAESAELRQRLEDLRSAWDLLEDLPVASPNPKFAQSTIEMVTMSAASFSGGKSTARNNWPLIASMIAIAPIMFVVGYMVYRASQKAVERRAIEVLPILADWEALKAVGSYEWLESIRSIKDLDRVVKRTNNSNLGSGIVPETLQERNQWIQSLNETGRDRLSANLDEFKRTSAAERERIAALAKKIYEGPSPEADLQIARDYAAFLRDMSATERVALDDRDAADKLTDLTRRVSRKMVDVYTRELTSESPDREATRKWVRDMEAQYFLPPGGVARELSRRMGPDGSVIDDVDLEDLLNSLTPEAQSIIRRLQSNEEQQAALVHYFVNYDHSMNYDRRWGSAFGPRLSIDREQLVKRFEGLPDNRRGEIEFLPPEQAQRELLPTEPGQRPRPDNRPMGNDGFSRPIGPGGPGPGGPGIGGQGPVGPNGPGSGPGGPGSFGRGPKN